ncbi:MAG TPA: DUF4350 domain-containing protein [Amnibacterium sp.]|jgi:hypothetical protein|uniref:DUF4350 domain-containing protein n=1 Tax=Amnibacterium sp. TaxID=1872496 RepID=UPI002F955FA5
MTMPDATPSATPTLRQTAARLRFAGISAVVVIGLALIGLISAGGVHTGTAFGPDNPAPAGAQALRSVLEQQGVAVNRVSRLADVPQGDETLLVDDTDGILPVASWRSLLTRAPRLVVVQPGVVSLGVVLPSARTAGTPDASTASAGCSLAAAERAGTMDLADVTSSLRVVGGGGTVCFADGAGAGQLVEGRNGGTDVTLLASATAFDNGHISASGNAAVALNALGASPKLVWYRPDPLDPGIGGHVTLQQLTPPWVTPLVLLLFASGIAAALWRGRRLGPLVVERLPVVVRSRETVEGRARLYQRTGARLRAADALRIGAIGRLAPTLGLSRLATVEEVATAAASALGRPRGEIRALLLDTQPGSDADLVRLSDDLARLEAAVTAAVRPDAPRSAPTNGAPR